MNYFDDYYNDPQPEEEESNYIPCQPKEPRERKGMRRVVSVLLVLALVIGICGATSTPRWLMQRVSDAVQRITNDKTS